MKKVVVVLMMVAFATSAMAGMLAQTAAPMDVGALNGTATLQMDLDDDAEMMLVAGRATDGAIEDLLVSVEVGYETEGEIIPLTVAVQYALSMLDLPVDLAVRADLGMMSLEDAAESMSVTVAAVVSAAIEQVEGLAVYAAVGMNIPVGDLADVADNELQIAGGATYDLPVEGLGCLVELGYGLECEVLVIGVGLTYSCM